MQNKNSYTQRQRLCTFTDVSLGDTLRETFRKVDCVRGDLHGYLRAVQIVITGSVAESTAAAAITKENLWGLADSISLRGNQHAWLQNIPGEAVFMQDLIDENWGADNVDDWVDADISSSEAEQAIIQSYFIPMSQKAFMPGVMKKGMKDGVFPLSAMLDNGELTINIVAALMGNWELYDSGKLTVKVILHTYWTTDLILPSPWRMDVWNTADNEVQAPSYFGKTDSFWCTDDEWAAFALPTSNPVFTVDGQRIEDDMDGARDTFARNVGLHDSIDDYMDNLIYQLVSPKQASSLGDFLAGTVWKVRDANSGQQGGGTMYVIRRNVPLDPNQTATYVRLLNARFDPAKDAGRLTVARKPAANLGLSKDRLAGFNQRIRA